MIILRNIYNRIIHKINSFPYETGGVIGMQNGVISYFVHDIGLNSDIGVYSPNIEFLNIVLQQWNDENIGFCGIIHSHLNHQSTLSSGDINYIYCILQCMPKEYKELYFPICVDSKIIVYKAKPIHNKIKIVKEKLKIL